MTEPAVRASSLSKYYHLYDRPQDRLKQFVFRKRKYYREFQALDDVSFEVMKGEVLGIVGKNGSGKSTLLQLVCGTLTPTSGSVEVNGRVAALLELGAGFNPEFTGRENVYMNAAILGLEPEEIEEKFEEIVEFSGIREFIDQPVKTYSSGMYVRLAFSVATSSDPDILVIDEALSVGDGEFSRKSFDRIMKLKEAGKTILFCSHSMYQIDVLCQRALWLEGGKVRMHGNAAGVTSAYNAALALGSDHAGNTEERIPSSGRIVRVTGTCDGRTGTRLPARSLKSDLTVRVEFLLDPSLPKPTVGLGLENAAGVPVSSVISSGEVSMDGKGNGSATVVFPGIPLMKGEYLFTVFLACERGLHVYDFAPRCLTIEVSQEGVLQGMVVLPHAWLEAQ